MTNGTWTFDQAQRLGLILTKEPAAAASFQTKGDALRAGRSFHPKGFIVVPIPLSGHFVQFADGHMVGVND